LWGKYGRKYFLQSPKKIINVSDAISKSPYKEEIVIIINEEIRRCRRICYHTSRGDPAHAEGKL